MTGSANEGDQTEQGHPGRASAPTIEGLVGRLEAMAGQLEEQRAEIARLQAERPARPAGGACESRRLTPGETRTTDRRGLLRGLLAAGAAATALGASGARPAHADARGTLVGNSTANYGLVATWGTGFPIDDPANQLPPLGLTQHGMIGTTSPSAPSPPFSGGVLGCAFGEVGVQGLSKGSYGVYGQLGLPGLGVGPAAVIGTSSQNTGVGGASTNNSGVFGVSHGFGPGLSNLAGTGGTSDNNIGVLGTSTNNLGVLGESTNSSGVIGRSTGPANPNPGVVGSATNGYGVFGYSQNSNGIAGQSGTSAAGCAGFAGAPGGYGIYGGIAVQGGYAGGFAGPVLVVGDFTATGGAKSAAVPHPDGTHRRLYCMESPESLFEDFGAAKLVNGRAQVTFDPDFVAVVHNDKYFIFPVPEGDCKGLYVSDKSPTGFEVRELQGGASTLAFSYRVVAKRKDIAGPRLEKVRLPESIKELVKPELPKPPEPPKAPEPHTPSR